MKTLYLVRHAKSSWQEPSLADKQRPLNKRGHASAEDMGQRLKQRGVTLDLMISSPALRAITTAGYLADAIDYPESAIQQESSLYFSGASSMLEVVQGCDPSLSTLMLVGHNPDMTAFTNYLCGYHTDNMPTCAISTIEFEGEWACITKMSGTLANYDYPKKV